MAVKPGAGKAPGTRGPVVIPHLKGGLRRGRILNRDLVEMHPEIAKLVRGSRIAPSLGPFAGSLSQKVIRDYLWVNPPVVIPKVDGGEEIAKYVCVAGIESFMLTKQIDEVSEVTVLRVSRRVDRRRMVECAAAELAMLQLRWAHVGAWSDLSEHNLGALRQRAWSPPEGDEQGFDEDPPPSEVDGE